MNSSQARRQVCHKKRVIPFDNLDEAEAWMDEHATGPISVYLQTPLKVCLKYNLDPGKEKTAWDLDWLEGQPHKRPRQSRIHARPSW